VILKRRDKMERLLIAIDGSEGSRKAVEHVAFHHTLTPGLRVTLLNVLPEMPPAFWDDGHILNETERAERKRTIEKWKQNQKLKIETVFENAAAILSAGGVNPEFIEKKTIIGPGDVADEILDEARNGGYDDIILGRRGHSGASKFLMGSVSTKVVNHGTGFTICVVE